MVRSCAAVGCNMRKGTNLLSKVQLFHFPKNRERRLRWETAVHRENWKATDSSVLCNLHFIEGKPSSDPLHPDYVPSVFSHTKKKVCEKSSVDRYERHTKRMKPDISHFLENNNEDIDAHSQTKDASTMTEMTCADILKLEQLNDGYKEHIKVLNGSVENNTFASQVLANSKELDFYTKLPNIKFFFGLLAFVLDGWQPVTRTALPHSKQLLLVLIKLRLGLLNQDLAYRFHIGGGTVSRVFQEWLTRMSFVLQRFICQPSQETIAANLPKCFVNTELRNVTTIVDCSEIFIERAFNLDARAKTYSNYKHHNTVKFLICCTPSGGVSFLSKLYGGRTSDKELTKMCGFLDIVRENDVILADRGFIIKEMLALKNATVITPSFTKGKKQLAGQEVSSSRKISRVRIHVERCIGRLKAYRILKSTWPISFLNTSPDGARCTGDNILIVIAALCNIARPKIVT